MKRFFKSIIIILTLLTLISCSKTNTNNGLSNTEIKEIKEIIDLVLSYENGYDDEIKKYITEDNFYIVNYVEFYSLYLGELTMEKYNSEIINIEKNDENNLIKVYMTLDMVAASKEAHHHEEGEDNHDHDEELRDEAIGEKVPVEVIVKLENGVYVIKGFTEYENLEKAKELNEGFK